MEKENVMGNMWELMNVIKLGVGNREQNSSQTTKTGTPFRRNPFEGFSFPDMRA